jgi:hypothetical protein
MQSATILAKGIRGYVQKISVNNKRRVSSVNILLLVECFRCSKLSSWLQRQREW